MGNVSHIAPSIHPTVAIAPMGTGIHTACFAHCAASETGDEATLDGAKAMAMTAIDFFSNSELRAAVARDFANRTGKV